MQYPRKYSSITTREQASISGGTALDAFNYLLGDWLRTKVLTDVRNTTWNTMNQVSTEPVTKWGKTFSGYSIFAKGAYLYGVYHLFETLKDYWEKD